MAVSSADRIEGAERVLTAPALAFVEDLTRRFRPGIDELLARRRVVQEQYNKGARPDFLAETAAVRSGDWKVGSIPADLQDRRVEITGPVDRKMIINALNSGASVFMADFEDASSPTWSNVVSGQANLIDAIRRTITYENPETGKRYALNPKLATLMVRPRGFHLPERHCLVDGRPAPGMLFDFGLFLFHNAEALAKAGTGPYFYLPKMQSHLEARLWNEVFVYAQNALKMPIGTIKATVLIETLPAAFEMDEILFELKEHSGGLNCGRWDYIFSSIKTLQTDPSFVLPDRGQVTMESPFLRSYVQLLIKTCHRRGAFAMGGMAAQIPIKDDPEANLRAMEKVRADKLREVGEGHDGTWVAHPGMVGLAKKVFDEGMPGPNQLDRLREDVSVERGGAARAAVRHAHRHRAPSQHPRRHPVSRGVAGRAGRGADLQPDGRRRHRGNLADADLAVAEASRDARRWPDGDAGAGGAARRGGIHPRARRSRRGALPARPVRRGAVAVRAGGDVRPAGGVPDDPGV